MAKAFISAQIELDNHELVEVQQILKKHLPGYVVWAFGSRVRGDAKKYSDLDLVIITDESISLSKMADLKEAFDESNLVFKVDVVDWAVTSQSFRRIVEAEKAVIQKE